MIQSVKIIFLVPGSDAYDKLENFITVLGNASPNPTKNQGIPTRPSKIGFLFLPTWNADNFKAPRAVVNHQ